MRMKRCTIGLFSKIITFLVLMILFVPLTGIALYFVFIYPQTHHEENLIFLTGLIICVDLLAFAIYRVFYLGLAWVEYDREKVIFHYSRKEEYKLQWEEIPGSRVQVRRIGGGYAFCIQKNGRLRTILLNHFYSGYSDFEKALKETGVLDRAAIITSEKMK